MALVTAIHLRGSRASQPAASSANAGYIYCVTDEGNILERSSGSAWQAYSPTGTGSGTVTNTGTLTSGKAIIGNGTVDVTVSAATGVAHLASGALTGSNVALATEVSGFLPTANMVAIPDVCTGRLTTESGVPVSTSDRTAQGTIYFTPCTPTGIATTNGTIALYDGTRLVYSAFTELSLALTATSGKNYDVFVDYNSGTPQLVLSAAWTTDTARADALGVQSGIIIKSGTAAYRWVGTIRASGSNVTADSGGIAGTSNVGGQRYVWNAFNQVERQNNVIDTTDSWDYGTGTIRQARGQTGNKVEWVTGQANTMIVANLVISAAVQASSARSLSVGVGIDTITAFSGLYGDLYSNAAATVMVTVLPARYSGMPGLGYHYAAWNEIGGDGALSRFYGDNGGVAQSGLTVNLWN